MWARIIIKGGGKEKKRRSERERKKYSNNNGHGQGLSAYCVPGTMLRVGHIKLTSATMALR